MFLLDIFVVAQVQSMPRFFMDSIILWLATVGALSE